MVFFSSHLVTITYFVIIFLLIIGGFAVFGVVQGDIRLAVVVFLSAIVVLMIIGGFVGYRSSHCRNKYGFFSSLRVIIRCLVVLAVLITAGWFLLIPYTGIWFIVTFLLSIVVVVILVSREDSRRRLANDEETGLEDDLQQLSGLPLRFTYEQLKIATRNFDKKIGNGAFGTVFEGTQENGRKIAVKRLESFGQGKKEFLAEVRTLGSIQHLNLVTLIGFCSENNHRILVYEFMCNGSLDKWIFYKDQDQSPLDWQARRTIILGIAKGLAYLHEECTSKVVHLDIKPQNILLDANLHAKISDFGMSTLIERDQSQVVTAMRGTFGYMAPEFIRSVISEKADVYSFGIVVMEIVCGKKNIDRSLPEDCMELLQIFMSKAKEDQLIDMVDKNCEDMQLHKSEVVEMMRVAVWCLQSEYTKRPSMSTVVKVLDGAMDVKLADLDYNIH